MDKLDIRGGQRWATAVEDALTLCPCVLVILSPSSVSSTNVLDEVTFALEEKKAVIPVFYKDCKVPLQLRSLQRIDFRADYSKGVEDLLDALGVEEPASSKPVWSSARMESRPDLEDEAVPEARLQGERRREEQLEGEREEAARQAQLQGERRREEQLEGEREEAARQAQLQEERERQEQLEGEHEEAAQPAQSQEERDRATLQKTHFRQKRRERLERERGSSANSPDLTVFSRGAVKVAVPAVGILFLLAFAYFWTTHWKLQNEKSQMPAVTQSPNPAHERDGDTNTESVTLPNSNPLSGKSSPNPSATDKVAVQRPGGEETAGGNAGAPAQLRSWRDPHTAVVWLRKQKLHVTWDGANQFCRSESTPEETWILPSHEQLYNAFTRKHQNSLGLYIDPHIPLTTATEVWSSSGVPCVYEAMSFREGWIGTENCDEHLVALCVLKSRGQQ